jgi:hypothetical protein
MHTHHPNGGGACAPASTVGEDPIETREFIDGYLQAAAFLGCGNDHYSAAECAGHDFYYSRNEHGTGFWDRDTGKIGERLTAVAHTFGEHIPVAAD